MSDSEPHVSRRTLWGFLFWPSFLVAFYLFSTGPVTRWFPSTADRIYAPLSPLVKTNTIFAPAVHTWLSIWGVKSR